MKTAPEILSAVRLANARTEKDRQKRGLVVQVNQSGFGLICWLLWDDLSFSLMHCEQLEPAALLLKQ